MIQYLIAGLVGGAVAIAQKPKKKGRRKYAEGGRTILMQSRSFNTYAEPVSKEVEQSAKNFVYRLDALFGALSLPRVKTYGWNGSGFEAVGSYDIFIEQGEDYDPDTRYILGNDYHDAIEEVLKFMCDLTGAKLEEYDREAYDISGSKAIINIDAMVEAHNQERAKLRERFGFAQGGRVSTYEYEAGRNPKQPFDVIGRKDGMVMYHTTRESIKDSTDKAEELLENGYDEVLIAQP